MQKVKVGLSRASNLEVILKVKSILSHLNENPNFPHLPISINEVKDELTQLEDYETKMRTREGYVRQYRDALRKKTLANMEIYAAYVTAVASGDIDVMLSSGFSMCKQRAKKPIPDAISSIKVMPGNEPHSWKVYWKGDMSCRDYELEYCMNPEDPNAWKLYGFTSKNYLQVKNLEYGKKYFFRVAACNAAGRGQWSNVLSFLAG
jgi:hypothetical protein